MLSIIQKKIKKKKNSKPSQNGNRQKLKHLTFKTHVQTKEQKKLAVAFALHLVMLKVKQGGGRHCPLQTEWNTGHRHLESALTLEKGPVEANDGFSVSTRHGYNSTFCCKMVTFTAVDGNYTYLIDRQIDFVIPHAQACKISSPRNFR